jgi:hypothetical protein
MKKVQTLLLVLILSNALLAQDSKETKPLKRIAIKEVNLQTGFDTRGLNQLEVSDLSSMTPNSNIIKKYGAGLTKTNTNHLDVNSSTAVLLGIHFRKKDKSDYKSNPILRIGLSSYSTSNTLGRFDNENRFTYDSLFSNKTEQTILRDSIITEGYTIERFTQQIRIDIALLFSTNKEKRWVLYGGIGANAGVSLNATTRVDFWRTRKSETYKAGDTDRYDRIIEFGESNNEREVFKNKTTTAASFYTPIGVDFRIGKKRDFWKQLHFFYEMRPSVNLNSIPELGTFSYLNLHTVLGLKITW